MILKKLKFYKNLIFFTLCISLLHIILGVSSLFYFYSMNLNPKNYNEKINSYNEVFNRINKPSYNLEDLTYFVQADLVDKSISIDKLPSKDQLHKKALLQQASLLTDIQVSLVRQDRIQKRALNVLLFSLIITLLFGWIIPGFIIKKLTSLLLKFKTDLQKNIESIISNWKDANLSDNQSAYLILSLQALSLYLSLRGDKTSTQVIHEITKNLNRIFESENQQGI